jgi:hypothetical protein
VLIRDEAAALADDLDRHTDPDLEENLSFTE